MHKDASLIPKSLLRLAPTKYCKVPSIYNNGPRSIYNLGPVIVASLQFFRMFTTTNNSSQINFGPALSVQRNIARNFNQTNKDDLHGTDVTNASGNTKNGIKKNRNGWVWVKVLFPIGVFLLAFHARPKQIHSRWFVLFYRLPNTLFPARVK